MLGFSGSRPGWGGEGKRVEREGSSEIRCQCLVRSELRWT